MASSPPTSGPSAPRRGPCVCLAAHCDGLHMIGGQPHAYGSINAQSVYERGAGLIRVMSSASSRGSFPIISAVLPTTHDLHPTLREVVRRGTAEEAEELQRRREAARMKGEVLPHDASEGLPIARRCFRSAINIAADGFLHDFGSSTRTSSAAATLVAAPVAQEEDASKAMKSTTPLVVNPSYTLRLLMQMLLVMQLPGRSVHATFSLCRGATRTTSSIRFTITLRGAEHMKWEVVIAIQTRGQHLDGCKRGRRSSPVKEENDAAPHAPATLRVEVHQHASPTTTSSSPSPAAWALLDPTAYDELTRCTDISSTATMGCRYPNLSDMATNVVQQHLLKMQAQNSSQGGANPELQRRAFDVLSLLAHCTRCMHVAALVGRPSHIFTAMPADNSSPSPATRWVSTIIFDASAGTNTRGVHGLVVELAGAADEEVRWRALSSTTYTSGDLQQLVRSTTPVS